MKDRSFWSKPVTRNLIGVLVLILAWYLPDRVSFSQREGFQKVLPYLLLLSMYGWIVFHNRVLLDKLYFSSKREKYFLWTGVVMMIVSMNIYLTIHYLFGAADPMPQILGFWVFTIAGAGIYLLFRYGSKIMERPVVRSTTVVENFDFSTDGRQYSLPLATIFYIESLENYIKVVSERQQFIVRMSLKDAEQKLSPGLIRISRSHLINPTRIESRDEDGVVVGGRELKIGKIYKKYVSELIG